MAKNTFETIADPRSRRLWRAFVRSERGDDLVEFALAAMVFFITVFGILEFGQAVYRYNMLADLAQEGARRATVCGNKKALGAGDCDIKAYVASRSSGLLSSADVTCDVSLCDFSSKNIGDTVSVQVQKSFTPLTTLIPHTAIAMSATSKMIVVR